MVAGTYLENSAMMTTTCTNGDTLTWEGSMDTLMLSQEGSILGITNGLGTVTGTLHDDLSATFEPLPAADSAGEPGTVFIVGQFTNATPHVFNATYTFVRTSDQCHAVATAAWTPQ